MARIFAYLAPQIPNNIIAVIMLAKPGVISNGAPSPSMTIEIQNNPAAKNIIAITLYFKTLLLTGYI